MASYVVWAEKWEGFKLPLQGLQIPVNKMLIFRLNMRNNNVHCTTKQTTAINARRTHTKLHTGSPSRPYRK